MGRASDSLSLAEARRIAIAAQGFGVRPSRRPTQAALLAAVRRLGVLQLDSVNVLCRAHYLPLFARLGAYDRDVLDRAAWREPHHLFEYWGHQASLLPVSLAPLFRWRMARAARGEDIWQMLARFARERKKYVDEVLAILERNGPLRAGDLEDERWMTAELARLDSGKRRAAGWWNMSDGKRALEWLFWTGRITTSARNNFARVYDLTERVLPRAVLETPTPSEADAQRELLRVSARALGIATEEDLADYFRLKRREVRPLLAELREEGSLRQVAVEGWASPAFLAAKAVTRQERPVRALLAPFDPLVWYRPRAERLFDFHYRIGIYTPAHLRSHGYYVLPFLLDDRLVARVDLKADREAGTLLVQSAHAEPDAAPRAIAAPLASELVQMASWLGLDAVKVVKKGKLASALHAAVARV